MGFLVKASGTPRHFNAKDLNTRLLLIRQKGSNKIDPELLFICLMD